MRFLHTADLHIDSPLRGLSRYPDAPVDRLRSATRDAFDNLVTLAIERGVDFVVIAGDLFDGNWRDMQTGIWTAGQFRRLGREHIPVYLLRGNHDAASRVQQRLQWPENVHRFSDDQPQTFLNESQGVALHGQGFADRETRADLVAGYPAAIPGLFNIGVLHTSLAGDSEHDVYAPTTEAALVGKGYDYWALGHIHTRQIVREEPAIVYPGNPQGRHIRETGVKGCYVVTVNDGRVDELEFVEADSLRWFSVYVQLDEEALVADIPGQVRERLDQCRSESNGRPCAVRVTIRGECAAHHQSAHVDRRLDLFNQIRDVGNALDDHVWIEKIRVETGPPLDLSALRRGDDLLGQILRDVDEIAGDEDELRQFCHDLSCLEEKAGGELGEAGVDLHDLERLRSWLRDAERILAGQLVEATE